VTQAEGNSGSSHHVGIVGMRAVVVVGASRHQPDSDQTSSKGDSRGRRCMRNKVNGDGVDWHSGAEGYSGGWCRGPLLLVCSRSTMVGNLEAARLRLIMYANSPTRTPGHARDMGMITCDTSTGGRSPRLAVPGLHRCLEPYTDTNIHSKPTMRAAASPQCQSLFHGSLQERARCRPVPLPP
jgi:hypothetical protein